MDLNQDFPEGVMFTNEYGTLLAKKVEYAWKLKRCTHCSMFRHLKEACRKKYKKEWRRKEASPK